MPCSCRLPFFPQGFAASRLLGVGLALVVPLGGIAVLYWECFPNLLRSWTNEDYSYAYLVPLVSGYIFSKSGTFGRPGLKEKLLCCGLALLSSLLFLAGKLGAVELLIYLSLWLAIAATCYGISCAGSSWLRIAFPLTLLLFAVPIPAFFNNVLSLKLRLLSSYLAEKALHALSIPVFRDGNLIDLGFFQLQVVDACSGLRYLLPTLFMSLVIGHIIKGSLHARLALFLLAAPIAILANASRIALAGVLGRAISPGFALGFFHDFSGVVLSLFSLAVLLACGNYLKAVDRKVPDGPQETDACGVATPRVFPGVLPLLLGAAFLATFVLQEALIRQPQSPARESFEQFSMAMGDWTGRREILDDAILASLWADDYVSGAFHNPVVGQPLHLLVAYYESQTTRNTAHAPTSCLLGGGWLLESKRQLGPDGASGRDIPIAQMVMSKGGQRLLSNFWFQQRGRVITSEFSNKYFLMLDAFTRRRSDGALVRIEMLMKSGQPVEEAQDILDAFIKDLHPRLAMYIPN